MGERTGRDRTIYAQCRGDTRIVDVQECPEADLAVASAIVCLIRAFVEERIASYEDQKRARTEPLKKILLDCIKYGENASIDNKDYLRLMGFDGERCKAGDLWDFCIKKAASLYPSFVSPFIPVLNGIIEKGTLATRILNSTGIPPDANGIMTTYRRLCDSLEENKPFSLSMQT